MTDILISPLRRDRNEDPTVVRRKTGVILPVVLVLALVLAAAVGTFVRRAVIDTMIIRNRDNVAVAETLARSGVHIARAILHEQLRRKIDVAHQRGDVSETFGNTEHDLTHRIREYDHVTEEGAVLHVSIFDNRARLNVNSLVVYASAAKAYGDPELERAAILDEMGDQLTDEILQAIEDFQNSPAGEAATNQFAEGRKKQPKRIKNEGMPIPDAEEFLVDFFERVIENMDASADEKEYDVRELSRNLLDYMDHDRTRIDGGEEDDYYQQQDPPYLPANKPLLSVQELGLVEGFDHNLVKTLEPYLTVYPLFAASGVNINTAPGHVLGSIYQGEGDSLRLLTEDDVVEILEVRKEGSYFCDSTGTDPDRCVTLAEADIDGEIYPPTELPAKSWVYTVISQVVHGDIERTVEAVINMTQTGKDGPFLLYWRMQ